MKTIYLLKNFSTENIFKNAKHLNVDIYIANWKKIKKLPLCGNFLMCPCVAWSFYAFFAYSSYWAILEVKVLDKKFQEIEIYSIL